VVLVIGAGLMIRTFAALRRAEIGIDPHRILTLQMSLQGTRFQDTAAVTRLVESGVERLQGLPGVVAAASTWTLPVELAFGSTFIIEGRPLGNYLVHGSVLMRPVSSNYCSVFGIPRPFLHWPRYGKVRECRRHKSGDGQAVLAQRKPRWRTNYHRQVSRARFRRAAPGDHRCRQRCEGFGTKQGAAPMIYLPQAQIPNGMTGIDVRAPYHMGGPNGHGTSLAHRGDSACT
jgi:putative ABC transport system permease protein